MAAVPQQNIHSFDARRLYIAVIAASGGGIATWALIAVWQIADLSLLPWLILFSLVATAVSAISERVGISFSISHAVILASAGLLGPAVGVLVALIDSVGMWLIHSYQPRTKWKFSVEQLLFNGGMIAIAALLSGIALQITQTILPNSLIGAVVSWGLTAILFDQINIWLVSIVIYLQRGIAPLAFWKQQRWAMPTNIAVAGVGGGLIVTGVAALGASGILLFALPLLLLAVPFRVYVRTTEAQLKQLETVNQELQALGQRKDRMLAILSHDMRSPLGVIKLAASSLDRLPNLTPEKQRRFVRSILANEEMLETLVNDIIDIEQIQMGRELEIKRERIDLSSLIVQGVAMLQVQSAEKAITLTQNLPPQPVHIEGDASKLMRVALNLVSNAIKYSKDGGRVDVRLDAATESVTLTVQDDGIGIAQEHLPHIFEAYYRSAEHEQFASGNGYGLAIVKAYVEAHDGTISVDSTVGQGTCFTVTLTCLSKVV